MKLSCVMVVDDNSADQFLSKYTIEEFDPEINVIQAYDGAQALELLAEVAIQPDVIFLDINMPGMNGFGFLDEYDQRLGNVAPVVMLTSSSQPRDIDRANTYGAVKKYVEKPMGHEVLEEVTLLVAD